jgi:hypothetical protein
MVTSSGLVLPHVLRRGEQVGVVVNPRMIDDLMFVCKDCRRAYDSGAFEKHGRNCSGRQGDSHYQILEREMVRYRDLKMRKEEQQVPEEESEENGPTGGKQKEAKKSPKKSVKKKKNTAKNSTLWTRKRRDSAQAMGPKNNTKDCQEEEKEKQANKKGGLAQKEEKEKQAKKQGGQAKKAGRGMETIGTRKSARIRG